MIDNCESLTGPRWSMPGDPRITPFGWFLRTTHLDELPQLLNVLRGEMSLIGPGRNVRNSCPNWKRRCRLPPALCGAARRYRLAQVQLPPDTDLESVRRKLAHDLYYIRHLSLWLDLPLLVGTALRRGRAVSALSRLLACRTCSDVEAAHARLTCPKRRQRRRGALAAVRDDRLPSLGLSAWRSL